MLVVPDLQLPGASFSSQRSMLWKEYSLWMTSASLLYLLLALKSSQTFAQATYRGRKKTNESK